MTNEYAHVRAAFREVALGLMEWRTPPPEDLTRTQIRADMERYGHIALWRWPEDEWPQEHSTVYRPYDPQGEVEPFNVQDDWEEKN